VRNKQIIFTNAWNLRRINEKVSFEIACCPTSARWAQETTTMKFQGNSEGVVRDALVWAAECSIHASSETEPEARDAYAQLAEEFESVSTEIEGLISTFEALTSRKRRA
jgi:hypothetical protein